MNRLSLSLFFLLTIALSACSKKKVSQESNEKPMEEQSSNIQTFQDSDGHENLIGKVNQDALEKEPYASWFLAGEEDYEPNEETISELKKYINDYDIEAFFGTWCGDSRREVPHFYKILEETGYDSDRLKIYAVGDDGDLYKKTPNGDTDGKNIVRIPTFIFYKDGQEVNRFVEHVQGKSLEDDFLKIVSGQPYGK